VTHGVVIERLGSQGCVPHPGSEIEEGVSSLGGVSPWIASIWGRVNRLCSWQRRKPSQQERDQKKMRRKSACFTEFLNRPVVVFIFSLLRKFSLFVDFEAGMRGQHLL
jgi:hypothetical protein